MGRRSYGFNKQYREKDLKETKKVRECGVNPFDTAEVYGYKNNLNRAANISCEVSGGEAEDESEVVIGVKCSRFHGRTRCCGGFRLGKESLVLAGKEVKRMNNRLMDLW